MHELTCYSTPYFGQYLSWLEETGNGLTMGRARKPHEKYWIKIVYISRRRKISAQIFRMLSDQLRNGDCKEVCHFRSKNSNLRDFLSFLTLHLGRQNRFDGVGDDVRSSATNRTRH